MEPDAILYRISCKCCFYGEWFTYVAYSKIVQRKNWQDG